MLSLRDFMQVEFDVKIDAGTLYDYMINRTYSHAMGVMEAAVGAVLLILFGRTGNFVCLAAGLLQCDYRYYGILVITLFYMARDYRWAAFGGIAVIQVWMGWILDPLIWSTHHPHAHHHQPSPIHRRFAYHRW